jgi:hypothetical protein
VSLRLEQRGPLLFQPSPRGEIWEDRHRLVPARERPQRHPLNKPLRSASRQRSTTGTRSPSRRDGEITFRRHGDVRVAPSTFRFSGLGITVRRIPLTSVPCIAALNRTRLNENERRRMRPKMRPPGLGRLADTLPPVAAWAPREDPARFEPMAHDNNPVASAIRSEHADSKAGRHTDDHGIPSTVSAPCSTTSPP